jgi:hypothetical protein
LAVFGVGGIAGLLAGFSADPVQTSELSPAEIVALRFFPGDSSQIASNQVARSPAPVGIESSPAPARYVLASAGEEDAQVSSLMFSPFPTYSSPIRSSSPSRSAPPPQLVTASAQIPASALAYAAPDAEERPEPAAIAAISALPVARLESANVAPTAVKRAVQPPHPASASAASPSAASQGPASPTNAVLNNAQIASIKERLKLTSYQSQLWPAVESALRDIAWQGHPDAGRKAASNGHGGSIDPYSVPVQRLKSAAFPLIMTLSDDQKQEVRTMVRLLGLENLASQF